MLKKSISFLFVWAIGYGAFAQTKTLKIEDTRNFSLYPESLQQLAFQGNSDAYVYVKNQKTLIQGSPKKAEADLLSLTKLNEAMKVAGGTELPAFPFISWLNDNVFTFSGEKELWAYNLEKGTVSKLSEWNEAGENQDIAADGSVAFTENGNLFVCDANSKKIKQISTDGEYEIVYGLAAHRQEFGITKGTFWSPKASKLAFYRMDQTPVTDYHFENYKTTPAEGRKVKYPMAGAKSHHVTVGVYDIRSQKTIYLDTGEPKEQYLTNITWSPDEKSIYVAIVNRDQNEMKLCRYSAESGKLDKVLLEEKHPKYVEPEHGPVFLPEGDKFLWMSERDDWQHLYLYKTDGTLIKQLTKGNWIVEEVLGLDEKGDNVFVTATKDGQISMNAYKVNIKSGEMTRLTAEEGTHNVMLSKNAKCLLDSYSNLSTPNVSALIDVDKAKVIRQLLVAKNPLEDYKVGQISFFPIKSTDGTTDLYARVIKPVDFDPNKKYPVMYYVYGGPHAQLVHNQWLGGADMFMMYMASQGYVIFTLDNRGSGGRGLQFENATHRQLGTVEVQDQMAGVEWLKKQAWVDKDRMGCFGWSFGGFMTTSLMLKQPGTFKAAVAGGPVIDWKFYEIMYTERYMDTPETNPEGYKTASLLNYVTNLQGKLLLIHGLQDETVVPQHTAAFINECIAKGVLVDYFPYPNHEHNVRGKDRVHLYKKVEDYFKRNL